MFMFCFRLFGCKIYIVIKWYKYGEYVCKFVVFKIKKVRINEEYIDMKGKVIDIDWF